MGFLGVAGIAIIAAYVYVQGRRRSREDPRDAAEPQPEQRESADAEEIAHQA